MNPFDFAGKALFVLKGAISYVFIASIVTTFATPVGVESISVSLVLHFSNEISNLCLETMITKRKRTQEHCFITKM